MSKITAKFILSILFFVLLTSAAQATIIDNVSGWNGVSFEYQFGEPDSATYGETFKVRAGTDTFLKSVTIYVNDYLDSVNPDNIDFAFYVYPWSGTKITGSPIYASSMVSTTNNGGSGGFEPFTFNVNQNLALGDYVFFGSASNFFDGIYGRGEWGAIVQNGTFPDGRFVYMNNGNNFNQLFTENWEARTPDDLAFYMVFEPNGVAAIPEPASMSLLGLGLLGLMGFKKKEMM